MKPRRGNPGLKGRLLDKSIEGYILALETINRLSVKYKIETFAYLICNAWELLLKAKLIDDSNNRNVIFYKKNREQPKRSISLRDCIIKVFPNENDPTRLNLECVIELRDRAVHLVISQVPKDVLCLFQSCVLNYHKRLVDWFGISLSERIPVGMMAIVFDFSPDLFDLSNPILHRKLGREEIEFLIGFQKTVVNEFERLNKPAEFSIDINYRLALVQNTSEGDIILNKGESGVSLNIVEVAKDPSRTHPYRRKEVTEQVNIHLGETAQISAYDIHCVTMVYSIKKRPDFYYKGTVKGSPGQFSEGFVTWILRQHNNDSEFFVKARQKSKKTNSL